METTLKRPVIATLMVAFLLIAIPTLAQTDTTRIEELEAKTAAMTGELSALGAELEKANQDDAVSDVETLRNEVVKATQTAQRAGKSANEWKDTTAVNHLAGYAAAGYTDQENGTDSLDVANFNPIFHLQYGDRILWESDLKIEIEGNGAAPLAEVGFQLRGAMSIGQQSKFSSVKARNPTLTKADLQTVLKYLRAEFVA